MRLGAALLTACAISLGDPASGWANQPIVSPPPTPDCSVPARAKAPALPNDEWRSPEEIAHLRAIIDVLPDRLAADYQMNRPGFGSPSIHKMSQANGSMILNARRMWLDVVHAGVPADRQTLSPECWIDHYIAQQTQLYTSLAWSYEGYPNQDLQIFSSVLESVTDLVSTTVMAVIDDGDEYKKWKLRWDAARAPPPM